MTSPRDQLMTDQTEPMDISPVKPSIPQDHLEPACLTKGAQVSRTLDQNNVLIETAARWMQAAATWKAIAIRFAMQRTDFPILSREGISIGLFELDHAKQEAAFWNMDTDTAGNIGLERQS